MVDAASAEGHGWWARVRYAVAAEERAAGGPAVSLDSIWQSPVSGKQQAPVAAPVGQGCSRVGQTPGSRSPRSGRRSTE